jgi:hypothetical protein
MKRAISFQLSAVSWAASSRKAGSASTSILVADVAVQKMDEAEG